MSVYFTDTGIAGLHREEGHVPLAAPEEHVIAAAASHDDETQGDQDLYKHLGRTWGAFGESSSYDCFVVKDMFCISCRTECLRYVSCLRSPWGDFLCKWNPLTINSCCLFVVLLFFKYIHLKQNPQGDLKQETYRKGVFWYDDRGRGDRDLYEHLDRTMHCGFAFQCWNEQRRELATYRGLLLQHWNKQFCGVLLVAILCCSVS